jgi:hypothetical protein
MYAVVVLVVVVVVVVVAVTREVFVSQLPLCSDFQSPKATFAALVLSSGTFLYSHGCPTCAHAFLCRPGPQLGLMLCYVIVPMT